MYINIRLRTESFFYEFCGYSAINAIRFNVFCNNRAGSYYTSITNLYSSNNGRSFTNPTVFSDGCCLIFSSSGILYWASGGIIDMITSDNMYIICQKRIIAYYRIRVYYAPGGRYIHVFQQSNYEIWLKLRQNILFCQH